MGWRRCPVRRRVSALAGRLRDGLARLRWSRLRASAGCCPFCGPTVLVRLDDDETAVRCLRCAASAVHLAIGHALRESVPDLAGRDACELSTRGALARFLRRHARSVALSEYVDGVRAGEVRDGVRCEDVQALTYADASFDLVTHTEVLEHVADDARAFAEQFRVLRPDGRLLFSVPLHLGATLERARLRAGVVEHLEAPSYHGDPFRAGAQILAFRDYGDDIAARVRAAGFVDVEVRAPAAAIPWVVPRAIIRARKPAEDEPWIAAGS